MPIIILRRKMALLSFTSRLVIPRVSHVAYSPPSARLYHHQHMWLSLAPPPQKIVINLAKLLDKPQEYRCFGFDCWHDYQTNPSKLRISWGQGTCETLTCERRQGLQLFKVGPIPGECESFEITVVQNFGGKKTYLNQIFLFADHPSSEKERESHELTKREIRYSKGTGNSQLFHSEHESHRQNYKDSQLDELLYENPSNRERDRSSEMHGNNRSFQRRGHQSQSNSFLRATPGEKEMKKLHEKIDHLERVNRSLKTRNQQLQSKVDEFKNLLEKMKRTVETVVDNQAKLSLQMESFNRGLGRCTRGMEGLVSETEGLQNRVIEAVLKRLNRESGIVPNRQPSSGRFASSNREGTSSSYRDWGQKQKHHEYRQFRQPKHDKPHRSDSREQKAIKQKSKRELKKQGHHMNQLLLQLQSKLNERAQKLRQLHQRQPSNNSSPYSDRDSSYDDYY